jgi:hypothetical protein
LPTFNLDFGTIPPLGPLDLGNVDLGLGSIGPLGPINLGNVDLGLGSIGPLGPLNLGNVDLGLGSIGQLPKLDLASIEQQLGTLSPSQLALVQTQVQNGTFDVGSLSNGTLGNLNTSTSQGTSGATGGKLGVKVNPGGDTAGRAKYEPVARQMAAKYGIDPDVFVNQITQESSWKPWAKSAVGALGLGQFMPDTARKYGLSDRTDPIASLDAAARHMRDMIKEYGSYRVALSAYNAGEGHVADYQNGTNYNGQNPNRVKNDGVPNFKETKDYLKIILGDVNA